MCLGCAALSVVDYSTVELKCQGQLLEIEWWQLRFALIYFSPLRNATNEELQYIQNKSAFT